MRGRPTSERIERSPFGQLLITTLIVVLILVEVGTNLPSSPVERSVAPTSNQIAFLLGSEQSWGVFAPDPRPVSLQLEARVTFADGSAATWHLPSGHPLIENLRYYRWRKWLERVRDDSYSDIWAPTARWIATLYRGRASPVTKVQLVRRFHDNKIADPQPPWQEYVYFTLDLPAATR